MEGIIDAYMLGKNQDGETELIPLFIKPTFSPEIQKGIEREQDCLYYFQIMTYINLTNDRNTETSR